MAEVADAERTQTRSLLDGGSDAMLRDEVALEDRNLLEKVAVFAEAENGSVVDEEIAGEVNAEEHREGQREGLYADIGDGEGGIVGVFGETKVEMFEERETLGDEDEIRVSERTHVGTGERLQSCNLFGQNSEPI